MPRTRAASPPAPHPARAYIKIAAVAAVLGVLFGALITFVSREVLNDLRHHLTLWLILALVAAINISSFLLFILFWTVYRWIKRDLEPEEKD